MSEVIVEQQTANSRGARSSRLRWQGNEKSKKP